MARQTFNSLNSPKPKDEWEGLPDQTDEWAGLPDQSSESIKPSDTKHHELIRFQGPKDYSNFFDNPDYIPDNTPPPEEPSSFQMIKDQFTIPNAIRTIGGVGGTIGGGILGGALGGPGGAIYGAMGGGALGSGGADALARWYAGEEQNPYASVTEGVIGGLTAPIGGTGIPGKGAGLKALGKYMLREGEMGAATNLLASPFRKWSEQGVWDKQGNLVLPTAEEALGQAAMGFGTGAAMGGAFGAGHMVGQNLKARQTLNDFNGPIPATKQAGNSSTLWDNVDFTQPETAATGRLLGPGPDPHPPVVLRTPDIETIQRLRDQGYVMSPERSPEGYAQMVHESTLDPARPYTPEEMSGSNDVTLQATPDNVVPFTPRPEPPPPDLDTTLATIGGAGERQPRNYDEQNAWEETPDDALRNGPVGIVQTPPPADVDGLRQAAQNELTQPNLPLNKRVIERAQRALRPSVPNAPEVVPENLPPHQTPNYQQTLPMYPVNPEEGGTGSADVNRNLLDARESMGREPTDEELQDLMWGPEGEEDPVQVVSNRGLTDPYNTISTSGLGELTYPFSTSESRYSADLSTEEGILNAYNQGLLSIDERNRAADSLRRGVNPSAPVTYPPQPVQPPPDPTDIMGWVGDEYRTTNDPQRANELATHYQSLADENFDNGFDETGRVYEYMANQATARANELEANPSMQAQGTRSRPNQRPIDLTTSQGINAAYTNYQIDYDQWFAAMQALRNPERPEGNAFTPRLQGMGRPYDPGGVIDGYTSEIDGINSEARALEHEHYWNTEASVTEGSERQIAQYMADYAHDRAMELRQNPQSVRQVAYTGDDPRFTSADDLETSRTAGREEINDATDEEYVRSLRRYWRNTSDNAADRGDQRAANVYRELANRAAERLSEITMGRGFEVDENHPSESLDVREEEISRLRRYERTQIDNATTANEARQLSNIWRNEYEAAITRGNEDPRYLRVYQELRDAADQRARTLSNIRRPRSVRLSEVSNPNDALASRQQHKARVATERDRVRAEEAAEAEGHSPLPVYRSPDSNQPVFEGMEPRGLGERIREGGEKLPPAPDVYDEQGNRLTQARLKLQNAKAARRLEIRVSQEKMDEINRAISEIDPTNVMSSLSHYYADGILDHVSAGNPGIEVQRWGANRTNPMLGGGATIIYRNSEGKAVAKADVNMPYYEGQVAKIPSFAARKNAGAAFGKGVYLLAKEFLKLNAFQPDGGYSHHTRNFIKEVVRFLTVDDALGKNGRPHYEFNDEEQAKISHILGEDGTITPVEPRGLPTDAEGNVDITPLADENGQITESAIDDAIAAESVRREPLIAIGDAFDQVTQAVMDAHAQAQLVDSPVTVREVVDRVMGEVNRRGEAAAQKARAAGIERGEILGGPPDDNGPGTTVGVGFGGMGEGYRRVKEHAGWGQGNRGRTPSRPESETQASEDYNWVHEALTLPRNAITTLDISYAGRQGLGAITRPEFWHAFFKQFGAATQRGFDALDAVNRANPVWQRPLGAPTRRHPNGAPQPSLGERMGLTLFEPASSNRPGARMQSVASRWLEEGIGQGKLSEWYRRTYGRGVRASNRMYIAMANTLVTKMAENMARNSEDMANTAALAAGPTGTASMRPGLLKGQYTAEEAMMYNPYYNHDYARELGDFIRTATGQAPLRVHVFPHQSLEINAEKMAGFLNKTLLSSGLFASRVRLTSPMQYVMASPAVRKEMLRSLLGVQAYWWGGAYALKMLLDATGITDSSINLDISSSDFGKLRIGKMRFDLAGGFQQFLVQYGRMWAGGKTSSASTSPEGGNFQRFGKGYQGESWGESTQRFLSGKLEPVTKYAYDLAYATENKPFHVGDRTLQLAFSLYHQDLLEIAKERPYMLPLAAPLALFGSGTQVYDRNESVGKIIPPEYDLIYKGGGGLRKIMPWNWNEPEGEYQGPNR